MTYKIQVFNYDVMTEWMDYKAAGIFETEEEAEKERYRIASIWTSMFKWSRVVPSNVKAEGTPEGFVWPNKEAKNGHTQEYQAT